MADLAALSAQYEVHLQSLATVNQRHKDEREKLRAEQTQESSRLAEQHNRSSNQLHLQQASEQEAFWQVASQLQQSMFAAVSNQAYHLQQVFAVLLSPAD